LVPQVKDEDGWIQFPDRETKLSGSTESAEPGRTEKTLVVESIGAPADTLFIKDSNYEREDQRFEEINVAQNLAVGRTIELFGDTVSETKNQFTLAAQSPEQSMHEYHLVVTPHMDRLGAIYTKITAFEETIRDREDANSNRSDFLKLEIAAAAIVQG
jgi:hypothetical protein